MMVPPLQDLLVALPEIFLACSAMLLLLVGAWRGHKIAGALCSLALLALVLTFGLILNGKGYQGNVFNGQFVSNSFTDFMKTLVLLATALVLLMGLHRMRDEQDGKFEFPVLILLSVVGMMAMISANSLLSLYMGLELSSLALYVLAAFRRDDKRSNEAGMKYFVLGALASGLMLLGSSFIYGFTGTISFTGLAGVFASQQASMGVILGMVLVMTGLFFKISAAPFHMWTPDVYEGSPTHVTAFFAMAPKVAALALLLRVMLEPFGALGSQWQQIMIFVSILTMVIGAFAAIRQSNIKRLLAYSSIGHVGYMLMGVVAQTQQAVQGIIIYLVLYVAMSAGTFACVLLMRRKGQTVEEIKDLAGLSRTHPKLAVALAIFMFSMAGIPPLAGFFGKMAVFLAVIEANLTWLAVVGVLTSVVSAFYYLRVVKVMYLDDAKDPLDAQIPSELRFVLLVTASITLLYFLSPTLLFDAAEYAAQGIALR